MCDHYSDIDSFFRIISIRFLVDILSYFTEAPMLKPGTPGEKKIAAHLSKFKLVYFQIFVSICEYF